MTKRKTYKKTTDKDRKNNLLKKEERKQPHWKRKREKTTYWRKGDKNNPLTKEMTMTMTMTHSEKVVTRS